MKTNKLFLLALLLLFVTNSFADNLVVPNISLQAGETKMLDIELVNPDKQYTAFQFDLVLPEGVSVGKNTKGKYYATLDEDRKDDHTITVSLVEGNTFRFLAYSNTSAPFYEISGTIVSIPLTAAANASSGELTASLKDIILTAADASELKPSKIDFTISVQGLPTVTADNKSREYGDDNPELTYTVSGGTISETLTLTTTATKTSAVGDYPITVPTGNTYNAVNGTLTVNKAPLTISGGTYSIKQGEELPTFAAVYSEFKNDETSAVLTTQPTLSLAAGVTSASEPGTYDITVSGATADNYEITFQKGTLTISQADPITLTANSYTITYGDDLPEKFEFTTSEGATLTGAPTISCVATADSDAGEYEITISKGTVSNYNVTYVAGKLTINPAAVTVTADNKTRKYGEANPEFTATYSGFVKNQDATVLTTAPTITTEATVATVVGTAAIKASGAAAKNYSFTYVDGTLTIDKATLIATAKSYTRKQGEANPTFEIEYTGWKNNEDVTALTTAPTATTTATAASEPAEYAITVSGGEAANYDFSYVNGTLTVTEADPITVTATSYTITYGDELPEFGYTTSEGATLTGVPALTCAATADSDAGEYDITISQGTVSNYNVTYVAGKLTINPAAVTVTADNKTRKYGEANPEFTATYSGFVKNQDATVLTTAPTITTEATVATVVGTAAIKASGAAAKNYSFTYVDGTLTIDKATLIATAKSYTRKQGEANPTFEIEYTGWKNNEDVSVLTTAPTATTTATAASEPAEYAITVSGGEAANYDFSYVNGTLTVTDADAIILTANSYTITYGDNLPAAFEFTTSEGATLEGTPEITCAATADSDAGEYEITISKGTVSNYNVTYVAGKLTINPAAVTVTADNKTRKYGEANPEFTATYSGFVKNQDATVLTTAPTITTEATVATVVGTAAIKASGAAAKNYSFTYVDGTLTIEKAPLKGTAKSYTVKYGEATPTLEMEYEGFVNNETDAVLTTKPTVTTERVLTSVPGDYKISPTGGEAANYAITLYSGKLTVTKAPLTIKADDKTKEAGQDNPELTYSYSGFVNDETDAVVTTKPSSITTTATATSEKGKYPITVSNDAVAANYDISYETGVLTVTETTVDASGNTLVDDGEDVTLTSVGDDAVGDDGSLNIPDEVTQIDDNAFDNLTDEQKESVSYVDMTNTNVTGVTVDRQNGVFEGFSENTMICLPSGNDDGGEPNVVVDSQCNELVLDDTKETALPMDFTAQKVTYNRALTAADQAYTICLPFSLSSNDNLKFYELSSSTSDKLIFTEVATTEPNKPYLAVPTVAGAPLGQTTSVSVKKNTDFNGAELAITGFKMYGTMKSIARDAALGFYILQSGNEWHPIRSTSAATASIPPYRAYIVAEVSASRLFTSFGGGDGTTGVWTIETIDADGTEQWYDLNGRKLQGKPTRKGTYIKNGNKVIIK